MVEVIAAIGLVVGLFCIFHMGKSMRGFLETGAKIQDLEAELRRIEIEGEMLRIMKGN